MLLGRNSSSLLFFCLIAACVLFDLFTRLHIFPLLMFFAATVAVHEATGLLSASGARPWRLGVWALVMAFVFDGWHGGLQHIDVITAVGFMGLFVFRLFGPVRGAAASVGGGLLCALWVGLGFGSTLALWSWNGPEGLTREGRYLVVFLLPAAMFQDVTAMWVGCSLGRRKLAPTISPHKTIEGSVGGLLGSVAVALLIWFIYSFFHTARQGTPLRELLTWWDALVLGLLFGTVGQLGDLCESLLKREAGVKDSGWTGTAHGGMLDIVDSLLFCAPVMYLWAFARGLWMFSGV